MAGLVAGGRRACASHGRSTGVKDLAAETGAQTVVTGAYYLNGQTIRFQAQVIDVQNGSVLAALQAIEVPSDSIREGIQQLRDRLMAVFAIRSDQRLSSVPGLIDEPPTYEAYRLFERGMERFNALDYRQVDRRVPRCVARRHDVHDPARLRGDGVPQPQRLRARRFARGVAAQRGRRSSIRITI